jgi:hypothetical protein
MENEKVDGVDPRAGPDGILGTEDDVEIEDPSGAGEGCGDASGGPDAQEKDTPHE